MYDVEHQELFAAIRSGNTINNGEYLARSTMWAILGRMVDYTGQTADLGEAINSQANAGPGEVRLRRRSAHPARQGRQIPDRHARRNKVFLTSWRQRTARRELQLHADGQQVRIDEHVAIGAIDLVCPGGRAKVSLAPTPPACRRRRPCACAVSSVGAATGSIISIDMPHRELAGRSVSRIVGRQFGRGFMLVQRGDNGGRRRTIRCRRVPRAGVGSALPPWPHIQPEAPPLGSEAESLARRPDRTSSAGAGSWRNSIAAQTPTRRTQKAKAVFTAGSVMEETCSYLPYRAAPASICSEPWARRRVAAGDGSLLPTLAKMPQWPTLRLCRGNGSCGSRLFSR